MQATPHKAAGFVLLALCGTVAAQGRTPVRPAVQVFGPTQEAPMLRGDTAATGNGWSVSPVITVGETIGSYQPPGVFDGIGVFPKGGERSALVLVNHELWPNQGYPYQLDNGVQLTGARVSYFRIKRTALGAIQVEDAGLAFGSVFDRFHNLVVDPRQISETTSATFGFTKLCSAKGVVAGTFGFVDNLFFTGEEARQPAHPHGGSEWVIDVDSRRIWAVPALGRGAWENVAPLDTGDPASIALMLGDDEVSAPLYLYIGQLNAVGDGSFLDRNGLLVGKLYAWRADNGDLTPEEFNGLSAFRSGTFVEVPVQDVAFAGQPGYDVAGYLDSITLRATADGLGCFSFSRPEDLAVNPSNGTQLVFASTGRGNLFPSDTWGMIYVVDVDFSNLSANLMVLHDADSLPVPDAGIRSPDNLDWSSNGKIYIQEDRATDPSSLFGAATGIEASIWELDPIFLTFKRILEVDRSAVAPSGSTDSSAATLGAWETSGILDVTAVFGTQQGERLLLATVQAHGIKDGPIGGITNLVQGGQLLFLSKVGP